MIQPAATHILENAERTRCEIWSRVMGYHRPVSAWNPGKQQEHRDRKKFLEPGAAAHCQAANRHHQDSLDSRGR